MKTGFGVRVRQTQKGYLSLSGGIATFEQSGGLHWLSSSVGKWRGILVGVVEMRRKCKICDMIKNRCQDRTPPTPTMLSPSNYQWVYEREESDDHLWGTVRRRWAEREGDGGRQLRVPVRHGRP